MKTPSRLLAILAGLAALAASGTASAQKRGGILKIQHLDNPASASIHEEGSLSVNFPFMAVFNGLAVYDQSIAQNSMATIRPELATSWAWSNDGKDLTFTLREGVKWHDGKPFTARDVQCTWDMLMGRSEQKFRKTPRDTWWSNVEKVTANGDREATFHLKRPQPSLIALIASGWSPVYPCHATPAQMRSAPIGTGPFKFVEFRANESIKLARNPDYWDAGKPYLDGIEYKIIPSRATRVLAFVAREFDMTFPSDITVPLLKEIQAQLPSAQCELRPAAVSTEIIINREAPPFGNPEIRRALALSIDRKAFIDILSEGQDSVGVAMLPPPEGIWGMPAEMLATMPGYGPDRKKDLEEARRIMTGLGYGPENKLRVKVISRNIPSYRDPAVILIDQLKEIHIEGTLEFIESSLYYNTIFQKKFSLGLNNTGRSVDDPDQTFYENYACGSLRNYEGYCNRDLEKLFEQQSMETDQEKRKRIVWEIEKTLIEDVARPTVYFRKSAGCVQADVQGVVHTVNSLYNAARFDSVWLDR